MAILIAFLLLAPQEPTTAELIRRLDSDEIEARVKAETDLVARGAPALPDVEAALASTDGAEQKIRLRRVVRKLRLADLVTRIPNQFSESLRAAAPQLLEGLKEAQPRALIEALAATTGRAWHWETVEKKMSHGSMQVPREIVRDPVKGATRSDAAEVILLALRALPDPPLDARWQAVRNSARAAIKPQEGADRRRLYPVILDLRSDADYPQLLQTMVASCRESEDIPLLLAVLDDVDTVISMYAAANLRGTNPGPHANEIVARLEKVKPSHQATLLRCLQNSNDKRYLKLFKEKLEAREPEVRATAFGAVAAWDPDSLTEVVLGKLKSKDKDQVLQGLTMARQLKKPGQDPRAELLREASRIFLTNPDEAVSGAAFGLLMWCVKPEWFTLEVVLHGLTHPMAGVRRHSAARGRELKGPEIIAALNKALEDPDDETAAFASISLYALKQTVPVDRVRALLRSKERNAKSQAMRCLVYILGKDARSDLAALLDDPDISTQVMAIYHFGTLGVDGYEAKLREKLKGEYNTCMAAARVLAPTGDVACWPVLKKYMGGEWHQLAAPAVQLAYPDKSKLLFAVALKVPDDGITAAALLENLRASLKTIGIGLEVALAPEILAVTVKRRTFGDQTEKVAYDFLWLHSLIPSVFWVFDGETVTILPWDKSRQSWVEWVKSR